MDKDDNGISICIRSDIFKKLNASRKQRRRREQGENHADDVSDNGLGDLRARKVVVNAIDDGDERRDSTTERFHPRGTVHPLGGLGGGVGGSGWGC
jgi:hypothetical protein